MTPRIAARRGDGSRTKPGSQLARLGRRPRRVPPRLAPKRRWSEWRVLGMGSRCSPSAPGGVTSWGRRSTVTDLPQLRGELSASARHAGPVLHEQRSTDSFLMASSTTCSLDSLGYFALDMAPAYRIKGEQNLPMSEKHHSLRVIHRGLRDFVGGGRKGWWVTGGAEWSGSRRLAGSPGG